MKVKDGMNEEYNKYVKLNSEDDYSKGVIDFTVRWAELMEQEKELDKDLVDKLSSEADIDGITGFMYDGARAGLYHFWEYGDKLKDLLGNKSCCMFTIN